MQTCISHRLYELLFRTDSTDRESLGNTLLLVNPATKMDTCFVEGCRPDKFPYFPISSACADASDCPRKSGWRWRGRSRAFLKSILLLLLLQEFSFHSLVSYSSQQEQQKGPVLNKRKSRKNTERGNFGLHFPVRIPGGKRRIRIIQVQRESVDALVNTSQLKGEKGKE